MSKEKKVQFIPATVPPKDELKKVVIYARESSNSYEQLNALSAQASKLTRYVANNEKWKLVDIFLEVHSSKVGSERTQLQRLHESALRNEVDIVVSTTISRFGRDTEETIRYIRTLQANDVQVIFIDDNLDSFNDEQKIMTELYAALAQAENENHSESILWGNKRRAALGKSKFFDRRVYGYDNDKNGMLIINEEHAKIVKLIFRLYLSGKSILKIQYDLHDSHIKSPKGKDTWPKETINKLLSNEKYIGDVIILKENDEAYQFENHHEPIISREEFKKVQAEKKRRSNVENGKRKSTKYSAKPKAED